MTYQSKEKAGVSSGAPKSFPAVLDDQFTAGLCVLNFCIDRCPPEEWDQAHGDFPFCQVVFHALFFTDFYLDPDRERFKDQDFHKSRRDSFRDYEEFEPRLAEHLYSREFCREYLEFCLEKVHSTVLCLTEEELAGPAGLEGSAFNRLELYIDTIRHIQHHGAQLGLRLQNLGRGELPWVASGWRVQK